MVKPREDEVAEINLRNQGYEVYRPQAMIQKTRRGKAVESVESLFPRYLFVRLCDETDTWAPIRSTKGVQVLVRFGAYPAIVRDELIDAIKAQEKDTADNIIRLSEFKVGEALRVKEGGFYGTEAIFKAVDAENRIIVLMNILGREHEIALQSNQVERVI